MKTKFFKMFTFMTLILMSLTSCQDNTSTTSPPLSKENTQLTQQAYVAPSYEKGIILGVSSETITEDSSNYRAVNGALLGGVGSYLLSSKPSFTKVAIGAAAGSAVGKMSGGNVTQYTTYTLVIKNIDTGEITQKETKHNNYKSGDTINYSYHDDIIY